MPIKQKLYNNQEKDCARCQECCEPAWKGYVRPSGFVVSLSMFFIIMLLDGNFGTFTIKAAYLPIMEGILLTITVAFYGSRGAEKIVKTQGDTAKAKASIEAEAIKPNVQEILDEEPTPSVPETAK